MASQHSRIHPALLQRFSVLDGKIPWLSLGRWPTPVGRLEALGRRAGAELWVKRDDLSGEEYGGNKVRKLEPLLAAALERGARRLLTVGGIGSNHVVACALYGRRLGLATSAVVFPQPVTPQVRRVLHLCRALQVELLPCPDRARIPLHLARAMGPDPRGTYLIGPGGSSPLGTLGFVAGALELAGQVGRGELPCPDEVWVPLGSGGTLAGLALGLALARLPCRAVGVRVVERLLANRLTVQALLLRTGRLLRSLGVQRAPLAAALELEPRFAGPRYGRSTPEAERAVALARDLEGLDLETTYSGKALAALLARARQDGQGRRLLLWDTYNSRDLAPLLAGADQRPALPAEIAAWLDLQ